MNEQTTKFSVFWSDGWQPNTEGFAGLSLQSFIDRCASEFGGDKMVAWAPCWTKLYDPGQPLGYEALRAESIAAGRLIEKVGDRYVARGVPEEENKEAFRVGGIYRTADGTEVQIIGIGKCWNGTGALVYDGMFGREKGQWLMDGTYFNGLGCMADMQLCPTKEEKEEAQRACAVCGGGRFGWCVCPEASKCSANTTERVRERLTWADTKPFNPFDGFLVTKGEVSQPTPASKFTSPDLKETSHQVSPGFGSAYIGKA